MRAMVKPGAGRTAKRSATVIGAPHVEPGAAENSMSEDQEDLFPLLPLTASKPRGRKLPPMPSLDSPKTRRIVDAAASIMADDPTSIDFIHTVLAQIGLPYRDPGDKLRLWGNRNGFATLRVEAGSIIDPKTGEFVDVGIPFGEKPRLALIHLTSEAIRTRSPVVEVADSLTSYVRSLGLPTDGRTIRTLKDQLTRLSVATIRLGMAARDGQSAVQLQGNIVTGFELWHHEPGQRVFWPSTIRLSDMYFNSLQNHAVPLDHRAVAALAPSAMALDVYMWLAQRLHRIPDRKPALVPWPALHQQFGPGFARLRKFREVFRGALRSVLTVYPDARVEEDDRGLTLRKSRPPVAPRAVSGRLLPISGPADPSPKAGTA